MCLQFCAHLLKKNKSYWIVSTYCLSFASAPSAQTITDEHHFFMLLMLFSQVRIFTLCNVCSQSTEKRHFYWQHKNACIFSITSFYSYSEWIYRAKLLKCAFCKTAIKLILFPLAFNTVWPSEVLLLDSSHRIFSLENLFYGLHYFRWKYWLVLVNSYL